MRIESVLRGIYGRRPSPDPEHADALESDLMKSFEGRPVRRRRRALWLLAGGVVALAGACVAPASYEMDVGYAMSISIDLNGQADPLALRPDAWAAHVEQNFDVDELKVTARKSVRRTDVGAVATMEVQMAMAGAFDIDEVEASLSDRFAALSDADVEIAVLDGTVRGTVGGLLGHRALGLRIDDESIEETRARILADLEARGLDEHATIEVTDEQTPEGRRREVRIEIEAPE